MLINNVINKKFLVFRFKKIQIKMTEKRLIKHETELKAFLEEQGIADENNNILNAVLDNGVYAIDDLESEIAPRKFNLLKKFVVELARNSPKQPIVQESDDGPSFLLLSRNFFKSSKS